MEGVIFSIFLARHPNSRNGLLKIVRAGRRVCMFDLDPRAEHSLVQGERVSPLRTRLFPPP